MPSSGLEPPGPEINVIGCSPKRLDAVPERPENSSETTDQPDGGPEALESGPEPPVSESFGEPPDSSSPEPLESGQRGGVAEVSEAGSRCGTELSSLEPEEPLPLLEAWPPRPLPQGAGHFSLRMRRASTRQAFGICFDAAGFDDQRKPSITAREDLPHLGILRGDAVLSVNGHTPNTVSECRCILGEAMSIRLVMRRHLPGVPKEAGISRSGSLPKRRAPKLLLSVTRAMVVSPSQGEFRLSLQRSSSAQKFGLCFREASTAPSRNPEDLLVHISQNLPHLALRKSDRLVEINGVRNPRREECEAIMAKDMRLTLSFRREQRGGLSRSHLIHYLQHKADLGEAASSDEEQQLPRRASVAVLSVAEAEAPRQPAAEDCTLAACVAIGCAEPEVIVRPQPRPRPQEERRLPYYATTVEPVDVDQDPQLSPWGTRMDMHQEASPICVNVPVYPAPSPTWCASRKSQAWIFQRCTMQEVD